MTEPQLPTYVPLDTTTKDFRALKSYLLDEDELRKTCDDIIATAKEYLDGIIEEDFSSKSVRETGELNRLDPIKTLVKSYERLIFTRLETHYFNKAFVQGKQEMIERAGYESPLSVDNIEEYVLKSGTSQDLAELIEATVKHTVISEKAKRKTLQSNTDYRYLKNATIIIDNPLQPLPNDEDNDDDDLEIAGGTVVLKCPITLKTFENPFISTKCEHVFDKDAIDDLWRTNESQDCPVPGCGQKLQKKDFVPDRIMSLRVKAWARLQIKLEKEQHYERI